MLCSLTITLLVYFVLIYVVSGLATLLCWAFNVADRNQFLASEESLLGGMQITSERHLDSVIELLLESYDIKCKQRNRLVDTLHMIYTHTVEPIVMLFQVPIRFVINKCSRANVRKKMFGGSTKGHWGLLKYILFRR